MKSIISLLISLSLVLILGGCTKSGEFYLSSVPATPVLTQSAASSTVSEVVSSEAEPKPPETFNITLSFLGDMILGCQLDQTATGNFNHYTNNHSADYFLKKVKPILEKDDFTIANLEVVLTDKALKPVEKDYSPAFWFKAKTKNIKILSGSSVEGVLLNNNHTNDYGYEGYRDTAGAVVNEGMQYGDDSEVMYFEKNGFTVAVLCVRLWGSYNTNSALTRLKAIKSKSDYQVVLFHGGTEKLHAPEKYKVEAAHLLIDNGADLIVGGHPHVLQPREIYKGKEIIYSIGNFCYGGARYPENRTVIYQQTITVNTQTLEKTEVGSEIIPCYVYTGSINNFQPAVIENATHRKQVLDFMDGKRNSPL